MHVQMKRGGEQRCNTVGIMTYIAKIFNTWDLACGSLSRRAFGICADITCCILLLNYLNKYVMDRKLCILLFFDIGFDIQFPELDLTHTSSLLHARTNSAGSESACYSKTRLFFFAISALLSSFEVLRSAVSTEMQAEGNPWEPLLFQQLR